MSESDADCLCVGGSAYGSRRLHEPGVSRCRSKAELTIKPCTFFCGFKAELILEPMLTLAGPRIGILFGRRIGGVSGAPTSSAQAAESRLRQMPADWSSRKELHQSSDDVTTASSADSVACDHRATAA
ncbi:uncharacterized protein [Triticum aestivum]|uniref:uncharacterized protein n=1 Tax=Triticum aestivum TaxID=4565 RepID=UPI001D0125D7|nr:uncharacterized protein LOC123162723 [Triticum aestivum]